MQADGAADFPAIQSGLSHVWQLNREGETERHVMVALPSFGVAESLLAHYADRLPALEHRYFVACLALSRLPACEFVFITCQHPGDDVVDYYLGLLPEEMRPDVRRRLRIVVVDDLSPRAVGRKLLDRPDLIAELRGMFAELPTIIEPWNVGRDEMAVAVALGAPINGTAPALWPMGFKSAGRQLFRSIGVPVADGAEGLYTIEAILDAICDLRARQPEAAGAVIKHDDSGAGDGNTVVTFGELPDDPHTTAQHVRRHIASLPPWYVADIANGCVVEELISGRDVTSPSAQADISPTGEVTVLSTHEQVLGGENGQVYTGCRFPARTDYATELGAHALAVGQALAGNGVIGRFGLDFITTNVNGTRVVRALEINLRKGGTTHPFAVLRNLVRGGHYEPDTGIYRRPGGTPKFYESTDNLLDPSWTGMSPRTAIDAIRNAGLEYDRASETGVVLHMMNCLAIDGRVGVTAIADEPGACTDLTQRAHAALAAAAE